MKAYRATAKYKAKRPKYNQKYWLQNKDQYAAQLAEYRAKKRQAQPIWADTKALTQFYIDADYVSRLTGIKHHVDHIVPLRSRLVCGLHVPHNLQIIPELDNLRKNNKFVPGTQP